MSSVLGQAPGSVQYYASENERSKFDRRGLTGTKGTARTSDVNAVGGLVKTR